MNQQFLLGMRASIPACFGLVTVGISFGLLAKNAGLVDFDAIIMSVMVMAGSAQLMAVNMIDEGAAVYAIILSTFFINLRHVVMSSSVMQRLKNETTLPQRLLGSFALCDESFAIFSLSKDVSYLFLLGVNTALYATFIVSTAIGCFMSNFLPQVVMDSFGIAFYAALLSLLIPSIKRNTRLITLVVVTAILNWLLRHIFPASWSVIMSMILGALLGVFFVVDKAEEIK